MPTELGKMTLRTLGCRGTQAKTSEKPIPLCRIMGNSQRMRAFEDPTGEPLVFISGTFEGVNLKTGQVYTSNRLSLPRSIRKAIMPTGGKSVYFAIEISAEKSKNELGFSYTSTEVVPAQSADPLAQLREKMLKDIDVREEPAEAETAQTAAQGGAAARRKGGAAA